MLGLLNPYKFGVADPVPDYIARYAFEETGTPVADSTGDYDGTAVNGMTRGTGIIGASAGDFDGVDQYVDISAIDGQINGAGALSVFAWIYPGDVVSVDVVSKTVDGLAANECIHLYFPSSGAARAIVRTSVGRYFATSTVGDAPNINEWSHYGFTYDGSNLRLYVNAVQVATVAATGTINSVSSATHIGRRGNSSQYFNGLIDDARIYDRAVSAAEVRSLNDMRSDFILLYHMDGVTTAFADSSGNSHTPTATGDATQSTAQSKFGGSSLLVDGTGDYIESPSTNDLAIWEGDFTIDCWCYITSNAVGNSLFNIGDADKDLLGINILSTTYDSFQALASDDGATWAPLINLAGTLVLNTWTHLTLMRSGSTLYLFQDGVVIGSGASAGYTFTGEVMYIGDDLRALNGPAYSGYIDEFAVRAYAAFPTTGFTPPTEAYSP